MATVHVETWIDAPVERCFDAARDLDLHLQSLAHTNERIVGGKRGGLIGLGEEVTWLGRHFGVTQRFTSKITAFDAPRSFQDSMQKGAFRSFVHDHLFEAVDGGTKMIDHLVFTAPLGILGRIAERLFLRRYLERLLTGRARVIKTAVEETSNGRRS